ncbi:ANTAR domain-containing response regulator [Desulforamulus hydrothermalis]|uniref:Stage 0 sporulation protein A homolog n=1 Tax=Desulforamulus hydrothermalis Lam5 = DSM 18033 TaxID=1121428 RepID=K8DYM7_9FIRM|nr:response regulator [Desulforamulus hydrothermalis]CCO08027.1 Response regulator receiver and ANTAR domain protein [Desulforamulus hydrothermalis Lam5 = DSM 18033]SHG83812.1 response regulator receiver and ANTAR domain protein [Desulforamulus hydrothermalis Lam5 = DSM 18033]
MFGRRVLLADPDPEFRKKLKDLLQQHGYLVAAETEDGRSTLQAAFQSQPDIIIMEGKLPGCKGLEVARVIEEHHLAPVVLLTHHCHRELIEEAKFSSVLGYLTKPIDEANLIPTLEMALATFKRLVKIEQENRRLKKMLEEKKLVDQAKRLLAEKKNISEQAAHRYLQKLSMDHSTSLAKIARKVILSLSGEA